MDMVRWCYPNRGGRAPARWNTELGKSRGDSPGTPSMRRDSNLASGGLARRGLAKSRQIAHFAMKAPLRHRGGVVEFVSNDVTD